MSVRYLLDTHAVVFMALEPRKLGAKAHKIVTTAKPGELAIAPTTVAELGQLIHEDKIEFEGRPSDVFGPVLASLVQVPFSLSAALRAYPNNPCGGDEWENEVAQGDRRGGGPAAHASTGNAGPPRFPARPLRRATRSLRGYSDRLLSPRPWACLMATRPTG